MGQVQRDVGVARARLLGDFITERGRSDAGVAVRRSAVTSRGWRKLTGGSHPSVARGARLGRLTCGLCGGAGCVSRPGAV
jgi:hypothetical protein